MTTLNTFKNCYDKQVDKIITDAEWLLDIKNGKYKAEVEFLRSLYNTNKDKYDSLKPSILPVVNYNFNFKDKVSNNNISKQTGLLFFEVDGKSHPDFTIDMINKKYVYSYYKSVSNNGYHILVRVENLTSDNFKEFHKYIIDKIGITDYQDKSAIKKTQPSIVSYDENLYLSVNPYIFDYNNIEIISTNKKITKTPDISILNKEEKDIERKGVKFRYSNVSDIISTLDFGDKKHYVDWDGINVINCTCIPKSAKDGNRQSMLLSYCTNFVILNPNLSFNDVYNLMMRVNMVMCINPVDANRIKNVVDRVFKYKNDETLKPLYFKRKIFFLDNDFTKEDKQDLVLKLLSEKKTMDSTFKLYSIIEQWDFSTMGKLTKEKIVKNNPISKKTVDKYWFKFKEYVNELNNDYKLSMKEYNNLNK